MRKTALNRKFQRTGTPPGQKLTSGKSLVDFSEIFSGGPPKDGIPAIDTPVFEQVNAAGSNAPAATEPVMSLTIAGDARAYPLRILIWHEIVNDTVGGTPVSITFCPLCNSGVVFDRRVAGEVTTFGTTGKLRNSDLVMYDRATESWWQQFEGRAIVGVRAGTELKRLPARLESMQNSSPGILTGSSWYRTASFCGITGAIPMWAMTVLQHHFFIKEITPDPGRPLMRVVSVPGVNQAWSLELLRRDGEIRVLGKPEGDLILRWRAGQNSALDSAMISGGSRCRHCHCPEDRPVRKPGRYLLRHSFRIRF